MSIISDKLTRRSFLALTAAAALSGCSSGSDETIIVESGNSGDDPAIVEEKTYRASCRSNCQSNCSLMAHVRNGRLVRTSKGLYDLENNREIKPDGTPGDEISQTEIEEKFKSYERICLRGLSQVQRIYSNTRILHPLLQTGERGDVSTFKQISWDEALELLATKLAENYDGTNASVLGKKICYVAGSGNYGQVQGLSGAGAIIYDMMQTTKTWVGYDMSLPVGLSKTMGPATFPFITGNEMRDVMNAKTLFLWGSNMAEAHLVGWQFVRKGREKGSINNVVSIDVMANTTAVKSDYLYRIRPGSDTMVALSMINVILNERYKADLSGMPADIKEYILHNTNAPYLVKSNGNGTYSYLRKKDITGVATDTEYVAYDINAGAEAFTAQKPLAVWYYGAQRTEFPAGGDYAITGSYTVNGIAVKPVYQWLLEKTAQYTPEYAEDYTQVSPANLRKLVDLYTDGPTTVYLGFGTSHHYNSSNFGFALAVLGSITGNIGKTGASIGNFFCSWSTKGTGAFAGTPSRTRYPYYTMLGRLADEMRAGTSDVKVLVNYYANPISNTTNAKQDLIDTVFHKDHTDFIVTPDMELTETARYSDLVLPVCHWFETEDLFTGSKHPYTIYQEKVAAPMGEAKSDMDIARLLSVKLGDKIPSLKAGLDAFFRPNGYFKTDWEFIADKISNPGNPASRVSAKNLKKQKFVRSQTPKSIHVSLEDITVVNDTVVPVNSTKTQIKTSGYTGKLELFLEDPLVFIKAPLVYMDMLPYTAEGVALTAKEQFPEWLAPSDSWEGPGADQQLVADYPLIYMQEHPRWRVHSQWTEVPWLRELDPEPVIKINPSDAVKYGNIQTGDMVKVSNQRGHAVFRVIVNPQMPQGIVNAPKGWQRWLYSQQYGDGGCYNDMTNPKVHPVACDQVFWDARVKIERIG